MSSLNEVGKYFRNTDTLVIYGNKSFNDALDERFLNMIEAYITDNKNQTNEEETICDPILSTKDGNRLLSNMKFVSESFKKAINNRRNSDKITCSDISDAVRHISFSDMYKDFNHLDYYRSWMATYDKLEK